LALGGGGEPIAACRAAAEELGRGAAEPFSCDLGESTGFIWISSPFSRSEPNGFSLPSFGRKDSVEPLFFSDLGGGRSFSVNRASSICRLAICPLRSSSRVFHSGTDLHSVLRASNVEKVVAIVSGVSEVRLNGWKMIQDRKQRLVAMVEKHIES
jgi:hypothetical protein